MPGIAFYVRLFQGTRYEGGEGYHFVKADFVFSVCGINFGIHFTGKRLYWVLTDVRSIEEGDMDVAGIMICLVNGYGCNLCAKYLAEFELFP